MSENKSQDSKNNLNKQIEQFEQAPEIERKNSVDSKIWYNADRIKEVRGTVQKKLILIIMICMFFIVVETIGAFISNSIAIFTDVAHLFSDLFGFLISLLSVYLSSKAASHKYSYGYARADVLGPLFSVIIIWGMTIIILNEAIGRLIKIINNEQIEIDPVFMLGTSFIGLLVNILMAYFLHSHDGHSHAGHDHGHHHHGHHHGHSHGHEHNHEEHDHDDDDHDHDHDDPNHVHHHDEKDHKHDNSGEEKKSLLEDHSHSYDEESQVSEKKPNPTKNLSAINTSDNANIRAAMIHILGDLLQSVGVIIASLIIYFNPTWLIVDPLISILFVILAFSFSIPVMKTVLNLLLDTTPKDLDILAFRKELENIKGVILIEDLHVWNVTHGKPNITCHLVTTKDTEYVLKKATVICRQKGIYHSTIQVELEDPNHPIDCGHNVHT